jgi:hypothetical protein
MARHRSFVRRPAYLETDLELMPAGRRPDNTLADQVPLRPLGTRRNNSALSAIGRNPFNPH